MKGGNVMNNELKELLQSVIHEAIQPLYDRFDKLESRFDVLESRFDNLESRFDKLESRFDQFETYTKNKFAEVDAKLTSISQQVAVDTEQLVEMREQMGMKSEYIPQIASINARLDELTIEVKVLKKAVAN